jgi:dTDP-4-dehydrorhamnose reductase
MLGHKVWQTLRERFDTWVTLRSSAAEYQGLDLFDPQRTIDGLDATSVDGLIRTLGIVRPDVVVNCVGIVKQRPFAKDPLVSLTVNSLLPHRVAALCSTSGARLIHISTDCVFSGKTGRYSEADVPDADDLYGRSKLLGEPHIADATALTLRTSIVGRELRSTTGVTEWFLSQRGGTVPGFTAAIFSGLTTLELARTVAKLIEQRPDLAGLYHVSSAPISKYELLQRLNTAYNAGIRIEPSTAVTLDRSLDGSRFWQATGFEPPAWDRMIADAAADPTPYDQWRTSHAP